MNFPRAFLPRHIPLFVVLLLLVAPARAEEFSGKVDWVYDGDTIRVRNIGKVRLLGIDAPETEDSPKDDYYLRQGVAKDRLRSVAAQATRFIIRHAKKQTVRLETGAGEKRDDYGRLLALVYLPDGSLLNLMLVENGLAAVYRRFDFDLRENFLETEKEAQKNRKGLWEK